MIRVCPAAELRRGEVRGVALPASDEGRPQEALVLRDEGGVIRAYLNRCMHLPIPIDGGSRRYLSDDGAALMCGTHGALFRLTDGYCTEGPCRGESLIALPVSVRDGVVRLAYDGAPGPIEP